MFVLFETNTENEVCVRERHFRWWARDREVAREPESRYCALLACPMAHARRHARAVSCARATAARTAKSFRALSAVGRIIKRRSRVLRRRTRQAALDKPRAHDGQLGFAILEQKACVTAENRSFEEKQPLVFYRKPRIHGFMLSETSSGARIWSWRRRWGEGSQNTALYD